MSEALWYGIGGLLLFFTVSTFVFSRIKTNIYPEEYEFGLDPHRKPCSLFCFSDIF